jgi:very-short-patch-repair endonuclease
VDGLKRKLIPYNALLKERAWEMRNNGTSAENYLWLFLKGRQVRGYDFHRQKPLLNYIVDFFCSELLLAIEVDGSVHDGRFDEDQMRQELIELHGVSFLRFTYEQVADKIEEVNRVIENWIDEHEHEILRNEET